MITNKNFYNIDAEQIYAYMDKGERLSSGYIDYSSIKDEEDYYKKALDFISRTSYSLYEMLSGESTYDIDFDLESYEAYCSLATRNIFVGLNLLFDKNLDRQKKVDSIVATVFHELYHKKFTVNNLFKTVQKFIDIPQERFYKDKKYSNLIGEIWKVKGLPYIFNIFEDRRIESLGAKFFPGYVCYFEESRQLFLDMISNQEVFPISNAINDFIKFYVLMPEFVDTFEKKINDVISNTAEIESIVPNYEKILPAIAKIKKVLIENENLILSHDINDTLKIAKKVTELIPLDFRTNKFSDKETYGKESIKVGNKYKKFLFIPSKEKKEEDKKEEKKKNVDNTKFPNTSHVIVNTGNVDASILSAAKKIAKKFRENFSFLENKFGKIYEEYELVSGEIDEDELYSISYNKNIFKESEDIPEYKISIGILLDLSGSMCDKIRDAKIAALSTILSFIENKYVELVVYGHNADLNDKNSVSIYEFYNSKNSNNFNGIFSAVPHGNNADGYAIAYVASDMKKIFKSQKKILIVISDGQPAANVYSTIDGVLHTASEVKKIEKDGFYVVQICMENISASKKMFKNYIPFKKGQFLDELTKFLITKMIQITDSF